MRLVLYEWCSSGGLSGRRPDDGTESIAREGRMMLEALARDSAKDASLDVTVLVDAARPIRLPSTVRRCVVPDGREVEKLVDASRHADWTLIVAPETGGVLRTRVREVRAAGGRVPGPADRFLAIAGDKQATIDALAAAGVPVPAGRALAAGEAVPPGFRMPAVRKFRWGAGCEGLMILRSPEGAASSEAARLEAFVEGIPVGVAVLCGPAGLVPLPAMRQRFSGGNAPRYLGGAALAVAGKSLPRPFSIGSISGNAAGFPGRRPSHPAPADSFHSLPDGRSESARAMELAARAVRSVERAAAERGSARGWVGVDLLLGPEEDGRGDRVLEVNPRLTTSFVGLSAVHASSLARAILDAADGSAIAASMVSHG